MYIVPFWRKLWTCRQTEYWMNDSIVFFLISPPSPVSLLPFFSCFPFFYTCFFSLFLCLCLHRLHLEMRGSLAVNSKKMISCDVTSCNLFWYLPTRLHGVLSQDRLLIQLVLFWYLPTRLHGVLSQDRLLIQLVLFWYLPTRLHGVLSQDRLLIQLVLFWYLPTRLHGVLSQDRLLIQLVLFSHLFIFFFFSLPLFALFFLSRISAFSAAVIFFFRLLHRHFLHFHLPLHRFLKQNNRLRLPRCQRRCRAGSG